jgi:protein-S-isoprenylcysteine O-methyltransferase Ste14
MNIQKNLSLFLGTVFVGLIFIGIPLVLIKLNIYFGLPVFTYIYFKIIGMLFLVAGFGVVIFSSILHLKTGRITPLPVIESPKKFIAIGFYKYWRNPMYLAEVFIFTGLFFLLGYLLLLFYAALVFIIMHLFVLYVEEPELRRVLGGQYIEYTKKVPRWVPKI